MSTMQVVAYIRANKKGEPQWSEDCCSDGAFECEDAIRLLGEDAGRGESLGKGMQGAVLDVGFKNENGIHTPTVLVGFAPDDWKARDDFAASLVGRAKS